MAEILYKPHLLDRRTALKVGLAGVAASTAVFRTTSVLAQQSLQ